MSKNNNNSKSKTKSKTKSKSNQNEQDQVGYDMWQHMMNNSPPQHNYQPQPMSFAHFAPIANPYHMSPDDPRRNYQHPAWYQNTHFTSPVDLAPNTYHGTSSSNPHGYQGTPTRYSPLPSTQNFGVPETQHQHLLDSSDSEPDNQFQPEHESEPDTQPETQKKKGKKARKNPDAPLRVQVRWSDEEARILAERWVHCSENGVIGRNQTNESFWNNVRADYNSVVNKKRNLNQLTGKWNKIAHDVRAFEGHHKKLREGLRQSGAGDSDVMEAAKKAFLGQKRRKFGYESCWEVLRHYPKFFTEEGVMSNKRSFQPEPEFEATDLGSNDIPSSLEANMRTLFRDDFIRRPPGRKASRNSQDSDAGSSSRSSVASEKREAIEAVKKQALAATDTLEVIKKTNLKKAAFMALSFLSKSLPKRASKKELQILKLARKEVVEEFGNVYKTTNEDEEEGEAENEDETATQDEESSSD